MAKVARRVQGCRPRDGMKPQKIVCDGQYLSDPLRYKHGCMERYNQSSESAHAGGFPGNPAPRPDRSRQPNRIPASTWRLAPARSDAATSRQTGWRPLPGGQPDRAAGLAAKVGIAGDSADNQTAQRNRLPAGGLKP